MPLSQDDRIAMSKKIIDIPAQDALADQNSASIEEAKQLALKEDGGNKTLMDEKTALVNPYQKELSRYDGNNRLELVESMVQDAAKRVKNNHFFPNDQQLPLPSIADGVWKYFPPFGGTVAIGKKFDETYDTFTGESGLIGEINALIATMEGYTDVGRSTGQFCTPGVLPAPDVIADDPAIQDTHTQIVAKVNEWKTHLNTTKPLIPTALQDPDPTRSTENDASRTAIDDRIPGIDAWLAILDFDTSHGQTTCVGFLAIDVNTLAQTKYRADGLQVLKDEITARQSFLTTRNGQLSGHLGSITQDPASGEITAATGFYGDRFRIVDMRLNLMSGSLSKANSAENGQKAQGESKKSNANATAALTSVMKATAFRAPAAGTATIHVLDATGFSNGDSVYVVANTQSEIATTISNIDGNTVYLANAIPKNYMETDGARLYKVL